MRAASPMIADLRGLLGGQAVEEGAGGRIEVLPDRPEAVAEVLRWCRERGVVVRTPAGRPLVEDRRSDVVDLSMRRLQGPLVLERDAGTVRIPAGTPGAELAQRLHRQGRWIEPRPAPFLREDLATHVAGPALSAEFVAFGMWESPLMALEAVLADGRTIRAGVAPRSAAGPDYRAFLVGGGERLGVVTAAVWRTVERSVPCLAAARFPAVDAAAGAARRHTQGGWRPFASLLVPGLEDPAAWRRATPGTGAVLLLCHRAEGERSDLLLRQLRDDVQDCGGENLPANSARAWYEGAILAPCQSGTAARDGASLPQGPGHLGTVRVAASWPALGAISTDLQTALAKGPLKASWTWEGLRPEGGILTLRLLRRGRSRIGLGAAVKRVLALTDEHGGMVAAVHDGTGAPRRVRRPDSAAQHLLEAVAEEMGVGGVLNPPLAKEG